MTEADIPNYDYGNCQICGQANEWKGRHACEKCGGPGRFLVVCQSCKKRKEISPEVMKRMLIQIGIEPISAEMEVNCGITLITPVCSDCAENGRAKMTARAVVFKPPTVH